MLGHASAAITLDVYADLFDEDLDDVAVALNSAHERTMPDTPAHHLGEH
jgi:integrase